jgi:hypothetical protein
VGTPHEVYNAPATRFVAQFVGAATCWTANRLGRLTGRSAAMLRPERIRLGGADGARASGVIAEAQYFGAFTRLKVESAGTLLQADLPEAADSAVPETGRTVHLHWDERAVHPLADFPWPRAPADRGQRSRVNASAAPPPSAHAPPAGCSVAPRTCCTRGRGLLLLRLLAPVLLSFGVVYLGSLFALLANAFFELDDFTGQVVRELTLKNFIELGAPANVDVAIRTIVMAVLVTAACTAIGFPSPTTWRAMHTARRRRCCTSR